MLTFVEDLYYCNTFNASSFSLHALELNLMLEPVEYDVVSRFMFTKINA